MHGVWVLEHLVSCPPAVLVVLVVLVEEEEEEEEDFHMLPKTE